MRSGIALLLALGLAGVALCGATRPAPDGLSLRRRSLLQVSVGGGFSIGGGGGVRRGFGGRGASCVYPQCITPSRAQTAQILAGLNSQSVVQLAAGSDNPAAAFGATQSSQRSAVAAANGDIAYLSNQHIFDNTPGYFYGGKRR
ncbi:hypothetical protein MNEG_7592 [Monoraphidium neglectum]|uniref:Uncharacterized protein n=1 Tax=Monoraphidium neglectum TaxID=145388 RepID=A0A0D2JMD8_9CHLO|nr:hypothetical protein MNEG_7592 [Monoraphidium neglectum]KIZ00368.1 hypothetical protein MNEG_7592 [Monoraphidium neglectum]|eukprot:XP_013899387.1 hypothetical protein MNEG_7592 [Monoraphidium neglectum]